MDVYKIRGACKSNPSPAEGEAKNKIKGKQNIRETKKEANLTEIARSGL